MSLEKTTIRKSFGSRMRKLLNYFLKGLLITLPIYATYRIIRTLMESIDSVLLLDTPGLGFIIVIGTLVLTGFIGSSLITRPVIDLMDDIFSSIPLVKTIYTSVKDLIEAFVGDKKKFSKPVIVELTPGIYKPGFITQEDLSQLNLPGIIAVYLPHSYAFSGNLFLVDRSKIRDFEGDSSELMKFIVSGGVIHLDEKPKESL
ncbi:MAG: DUF502 domain-containing protein [Bacteroidia bacterium]|nr:DUF502 domain-containing protein [Bacteroidia bacterium]MCF8426048.1 DUF502 domain-containing protein [Bacteroidia bacterium]MCF8445357.1 DUF502 domain-containing protein [Bacteroidia bacterium]